MREKEYRIATISPAKKKYWGQHFWAIGYGAWSTGNITDKLVEEYLEHHFNQTSNQEDKLGLE